MNGNTHISNSHQQRREIRRGVERETIDSTPKRDKLAADKKK